MQINSLKVRNYRALRDVSLSLSGLDVVIGPNGAGKTTLLDVFALLREAVQERLGHAIGGRGGMARMSSLTGAESPIEFTIDTSPLDGDSKAPLHYSLHLSSRNNGHVISKEILSQQQKPNPPPMFFIQSSETRRTFFNISTGLLEEDLFLSNSETILAQLGKSSKQGRELREFLGKITHYSSVATNRSAPIRLSQQLIPPERMFPSPSGEDLLSVLYQMKVEFEDEFEDLQDCLRTGFKHFKKIEFPSVAGGQITLSWHQTNLKKPIYINELSDGTLRFLFLVALLLSPSPPSMILLDEPEDGLHPSLVEIIRELLVQASRKTQIIVATHSSSLIRELEPKHVVVADFEDESESLHFRRASDLDLTEWLKKFTLDQLWQMGELGGRP